MRDRSQFVLILLTFLGVVGIYIGLWIAYQKYQLYKGQLDQASQGGIGGILGLLSGIGK